MISIKWEDRIGATLIISMVIGMAVLIMAIAITLKAAQADPLPPTHVWRYWTPEELDTFCLRVDSMKGLRPHEIRGRLSALPIDTEWPVLFCLMGRE